MEQQRRLSKAIWWMIPIGFVACCRIFFMLNKNHRARCSNNGCELDGTSPTEDHEKYPATGYKSNGDHSPNCFRQTSLLFHKWLAERFNLHDAWIVIVRYKDTSMSEFGAFKSVSVTVLSFDNSFKTGYSLVLQKQIDSFKSVSFFHI
jgi:hypothetical protein